MTGRDYLAKPEDGTEILRILESSPAKGSIELLYTRRPDAYASYEKEAGDARVFAARAGDKLVGTCAELIRQVYIGGKPVKAAYICGLKKDADHSGHIGFGPRFIQGLVREDIDFYYASVVSDNDQANAMFGKVRRILEMNPVQTYTTYILAPKFKLKTSVKDCMFRRAKAKDEASILEFLNREGRKKDLFPVINSISQFHGLSIEDFYLLERNGEIVAAAALWDQMDYKQYVVKKYRGIMKFARILNPILSMLGYMKLPPENQTLDYPMLSFFLSRDDEPEYYKAFLNGLNREVRSRTDVYVIGVPQNHVGHKIFSSVPSINFDTVIYSVQFKLGNGKSCLIDPNHLLPECGLL